MTTFAIRRAALEDVAVLAYLNGFVQHLHHEAQPERYKPVQPDDPSLIAWFEQQLARPDCIILMAEEAGTARGYILCVVQHREETPFAYASSRLHIDQLCVMPSHQKRGIGGLLMESAVDLAKTYHTSRVTLGVMAFNSAALNFYQRRDFITYSLTMELVLE